MKSAIFCLLLVVALAQHKLNFIEQVSSQASIDDILDNFAEMQQEVYRKVFRHFMKEKLDDWRSKGYSSSHIKKELSSILSGQQGNLLQDLTDFMQKRLFQRLDMISLTQTLQQEIKNRPENFYLTFDIYDLLLD